MERRHRKETKTVSSLPRTSGFSHPRNPPRSRPPTNVSGPLGADKQHAKNNHTKPRLHRSNTPCDTCCTNHFTQRICIDQIITSHRTCIEQNNHTTHVHRSHHRNCPKHPPTRSKCTTIVRIAHCAIHIVANYQNNKTKMYKCTTNAQQFQN